MKQALRAFLGGAILLLAWDGGMEQTGFAGPNVVAWGDNAYGQTNVPPDLTNAIGIAAGTAHSLAVRADGTVVAWGLNSYGQTNVPPGLSNVIAVACGANHSLALKQDGTVVAWGGISPVIPPPDLSNVVAIAGGGSASYALLADGSLRVWPAGAGSAGNIGNIITLGGRPSWSSSLAAMTVNGSLYSGTYDYPANPGASLVCAAAVTGVGLTVDGRVTYYNNPLYVTGLSNIVAIAPRSSGFLALRSDGTVYNGLSSLSNVVAIACGNLHNLALMGAGAPVFANRTMSLSVALGRTARFYAPATGAWPLSYQWQFQGRDLPGATTPMLALSNITARDFGSYQLVASNALGVTTCPAFQLSLLPIVGPELTPNLTDVVSIASSTLSGHYLALKRDGNVVAWGKNDVGQCDVPATLSNAVAIACWRWGNAGSSGHSLALTASGTVYSWGQSLFTNTWPSLTNLSLISAGGVQDAAITSDGALALWYASSVPAPPQVSTTRRYLTEVAVSKESSANWVVQRSDGLPMGAASAPQWLSNVVSVACGASYEVALRSDGTVVAWGDNRSGQTNVPASLSNVVQITTTDQSCVIALKEDGTLAAWGAEDPAVSNLVATVTNAVMIDGPLALIGNGPPFVLNRGVNRFAAPGGEAYFRATATGEYPLHYQWQYEGVDLPGETRSVLHLTHLLPSQAGNYTFVVTNAYGAITSSPSYLTVYDYAPVLGSNIAWSSFGDALWFPETNVTHSGGSAVQSGAIASSGWTSAASVLRGTVTGPGTLRFWWKVSGTPGFEFLSFFLNGAPTSECYISGETDWEERTVYLGAGEQTLDWKFRTDFSTVGQHAGWVDQVSFTPGVTPAFITAQPRGRSQAPGGNASFGVSAQGTPPLSYQWNFGMATLPGATNSSLTITNVQADNAGWYSVQVSNVLGSVTSGNARLVLGRIASWPTATAPDTFTNAAALDGGLALQLDGTIRAWSWNPAPDVPSSLTNARNVSAGSTFNCAVNAADGTVCAWGDNNYGQTNVPPGLSNVLMVACGYAHAAALKEDGTIVAWGDNSRGQTEVPSGLSNVVSICANFSSTAALKSDGTVQVWGDNAYGQTNLPAGLSDVVSVRLGYSRGLALRSDGTVAIWGSTNSGLAPIPANVSNIVAIACADGNLALNDQGNIIFWGPGQPPPPTLGPLSYLERTGDGGLASERAPIVPVSPRCPQVTGGRFQWSVSTLAGRVYRLEFKTSLAEPNWQALPLVAGTGRDQVLADPSPLSDQRFYRVRSW